ncbi:hypothetical protein [Sphingomonas sp. DBB INV C78]|uniref:hypothetical protein n=1 Tax=Sphingomonas sp. DBB INV C78 TaxID=3349434 RepID=UPI0036D27EDD
MVTQKDEEGCGIACVAMLAGTTYAVVAKTYRRVCGKKPGDKVEGTALSELKEIMRQHGVQIEGRGRWIGRRRPDELDLDCPALIKMNPRQEGERWHWAIWDHRGRTLLDPKVPAYKRQKFISYWRLRLAPEQGA